MNKTKICILGLLATAFGFQSCLDIDNDGPDGPYDALVSVRTTQDGLPYLVLDDETSLYPENVTKPLFNGKHMRALVKYTDVDKTTPGFTKTVQLNRIDTIRTKQMEVVTDNKPIEAYGNDPIEIINDWTTVCEDGFLTLRVRAPWSIATHPHRIDLVGNVNSENPYEVLLCHDANDDLYGDAVDALVAFDLATYMPREPEPGTMLTVKWKSPTGMKEAKFEMKWKHLRHPWVE
ncbi:MAG: NigD-like protein [Bacteroides sp.]|nr:NigD-like protein [Bacteroides sp.]MCM1458382.1 NigD-like protein [Lachnoclostridium sp.]